MPSHSLSFSASSLASTRQKARTRRFIRCSQCLYVMLLLFASHAIGEGSKQQQLDDAEAKYRSLKQASLLELVDEDDPFASAEAAYGTGFFPGLFQSAVGYMRQRQFPPWLGGGAGARSSAALGSRGNATHTYRFSHTMQLEIPQLWDTVNMSQIVRDNLEPDLLFWQQVEYIPTVRDLFDQARHNPQITAVPNTRRLVEIRNNVLRFPLMPPGRQQFECDEMCDPQLFDFVVAMKDAVQVFNLTLPDVLFLLNTDDAPICNQEQVMTRECTAPLISLAKEVRMADLIGPVMKRSDSKVVYRYAPWTSKKNMAFFRGVPSCGDMPFPPLCARSLVARLAQVNYSDILDTGIVEEYGRPDQVKGDPVLRDGNGSLPVLPRVPMSELPNYKWLLNLDGHIAAYRLAQLLATNSLVLKQQSDMVEYYYRSLRPFHHYVPIFKTSEHDLMPRIQWAMTHEDIVKRIVSNANHFALTYTTYKARIVYWKYVLLAYRRLIPDMDEYFKSSSAGSSGIESLLKRLAGVQQRL